MVTLHALTLHARSVAGPWLIVLGALALSWGCDVDDLTDPPRGTLQAIVVEPATASLTLSGSEVKTQSFRAFGVYAESPLDGSAATAQNRVDITSRVSWRVEDRLMGRFVENTFRTEVSAGSGAAGQGGQTTVTASLDQVSGQATLKVRFERTYLGPQVPSDAAKRFGGAVDPSRSPAILYPLDGALMPPNLPDLELQWNAGQGNDLVEVQITSPVCDIRIYSSGSAYKLEKTVWQAVARTNRDQEMTLRLRGTSSKSASTVGVSATRKWSLSRTDVKGGLYYWVVSGHTDSGAIYRYNFDQPEKAAEPYLDSKQTKECVGCHSISRDGKTIAFTRNGTDGKAAVLEVETRKAIVDSQYYANFHSFSPDGKEVIAAVVGLLKRRQVAGGKELEDLPIRPAWATHPDWSPDGKSVVYTSVQQKDYKNDVRIQNGSIAIIDRLSSGWGTPRVLVQGGGGVNNYYPSFSPGGEWVLFNRSTGDAYSDEDAELFVVRSTGGTPIALTRTGGAKLSNSWGRWSPFVQAYQGGSVYWITFSSVRDYGFRLQNSKTASFDDKSPQVWMTAFYRPLADQGKDPSYAPFWLPFQSIQFHNHIAQWTTTIIEVK